MQTVIILLSLILIGIVSLVVYTYLQHREDTAAGHYKRFEYDVFIEQASVDFYASRIKGLFTGEIDRKATAKAAKADAMQMWEQLHGDDRFDDDVSEF